MGAGRDVVHVDLEVGGPGGKSSRDRRVQTGQDQAGTRVDGEPGAAGRAVLLELLAAAAYDMRWVAVVHEGQCRSPSCFAFALSYARNIQAPGCSRCFYDSGMR